MRIFSKVARGRRQHPATLTNVMWVVALAMAGCSAGQTPVADAAVGADAPDKLDSRACTPSAGTFFDGTGCLACRAACAAGQRESAACTAAHDRACTDCTPIENCLAEI